MNFLPKNLQDFSQKAYWDAFFKKRGKKAFEWYGEYPELAGQLHKYIKQQDSVVIIGCGNSTLGRDLYDVGYSKITNIDISPVVIRQMQSQNDKERPGLAFLQMDALNMSFENDSYSVALDKGTLDALTPDDKTETLSNVDKYFREITRILKNGGRYICISLLQQHILKVILEYFPTNNFMVRVVRCHEAEHADSESSSMPVFMVICTKFKALTNMILEINLTSSDKMQRMQTVEEIQNQVSNVQKSAFVMSGLKRCALTDSAEASFDLFKANDKTPRYTVHVVDIPKNHKNSEYAAFITPNGRENDWLVSTAEGRKYLVAECKHNRLAIFTMHAGHKYGNLDEIQKELADVVVNLAPNSFKKKIPFLSLGSNTGNSIVRHRGTSKISGDYVIEDTENMLGEKLRKLYYTKTPDVTQSEAKLKIVSMKNGKTKEIINFTYLICDHHKLMSVATKIACQNKQKSSIVVIGLGGGGLCTFLHKFLPNTHITAVDIDEDMLEVATKWFGLKQHSLLTVKILDGLVFLEDIAKKGVKYDAILFDVDSKDTSLGMSCPPKEFIQESVLRTVHKVLHQNGLFVLNLVLRDKGLRPRIMEVLEDIYEQVYSYTVDEDLNEILVCTTSYVKGDLFEKKYAEAEESLKAFVQRNNK